MKVSIVVPVYNVEKYIVECAESLFNQTYQDIEYLFVDDCSPDDSMHHLRQTMNRFTHRRGQVRFFPHEQNCGSGAARQTAMEQLRGDCVMFVDSDDRLPADAVQNLVDRMKETDADMVDGAYEAFTSEGKGTYHAPFKGNSTYYLQLLLCQNIVSNRIWGRLYKRTLFTHHGIKFEKGVDYGEDFSVITRLLYFANRATTDAVCYHYRADNGASYTHNISRKANQSWLRANQIVMGFFSERNDKHCYSTALRMGMVDIYRHTRRFGYSTEEVDQMFHFTTRCPGAWLCIALLKGKHTYALGNMLYKLSRRLYTEWLRMRNALS